MSVLEQTFHEKVRNYVLRDERGEKEVELTDLAPEVQQFILLRYDVATLDGCRNLHHDRCAGLLIPCLKQT